ncbi:MULTISPECIES: Stealth CR1 domain-containing protein [Undibacterium]|nr:MULTISPECIES: Stealth CR1 domain-containing protein [Undibacterium]
MNDEQKVVEKIDIVYLWVDGTDPMWQIKREKEYAQWVIENPHELAAHGNTAGRYRDNGELLFNLRALEKFFPDHGHVYIVSDNQTPSWLRASDDITIIDHRDLIRNTLGPVFDSGHIESYLHHIPGLSEKFIYLNDDVFFGANVDPDWWFGDCLRIFSEINSIPDYEALQPQESALVNASILSKTWLSQRYPTYRHDPRVYSHSPRPMLRSVMFELEKIAPELFAQVRSTTFRTWRSPAIVPDLVPRWMVEIGVAQQIVLDPLHINTGGNEAKLQFDALLAQFGELPFFCINDTCDDASENDFRLLRVAQTLKKLLPEPSKFELLFRHSTASSSIGVRESKAVGSQ